MLPWFLPGLAITTVIALSVAGRVARRLRTESWIAFLLLMSVGAVLGRRHPTRRRRVQWPTFGTRPVRVRAHRTGAALPIPPPWRHQPQRHPVRTARPGDRAPRSVPCRPRPRCLWLPWLCRWPSKPSNRWCRCSVGCASEPGCRRQPPWARHWSRAGGVAVSRSSAPARELKRSGCPLQDPTHEVGARPSATFLRRDWQTRRRGPGASGPPHARRGSPGTRCWPELERLGPQLG